MSDLVLNFSNFRYHSNNARYKVNINDTIKLADFETPGLTNDSPLCLLYKHNFWFKNNHLVTMATRVGTRCHIKDIVKLGDPYNAPLSAFMWFMSLMQAQLYGILC